MKVIVANSRMRGFSLVELMVAITISSLLLVGVVALFISSRASYETTERLSRIQENGRFALDQLATDIRAAGFQGCARGTTPRRREDYRISSVFNSASPDLRWNFAVATQGFDGGSSFTPALTQNILAPAADPQGDILVLRIPRREARALELRESQVAATDPLQVYDVAAARLAVGDIVTVSDCEARAFFQVTAYNAGEIAHGTTPAVADDDDDGVHTPGNSTNTFLHPFKKGASVLPVVTMIYYLAPPPDEAGEGVNRPMSLWRKTGGATRSDEIAQGIERLEVRYGVDDGVGGAAGDGRVDRYREAAAITNWDQVLTVQLALLARAPEEYGADRDTMRYVLFPADAATNTPVVEAGPFNDRRQRKVFTATLALRNQIFD